MTHYMTGDEYQHGYDDGLSEGERRGWDKAIEAAAELMAGAVLEYTTESPVPKLAPMLLGIRKAAKTNKPLSAMVTTMEGSVRAAAIRKLKKP